MQSADVLYFAPTGLPDVVGRFLPGLRPSLNCSRPFGPARLRRTVASLWLGTRRHEAAMQGLLFRTFSPPEGVAALTQPSSLSAR